MPREQLIELRRVPWTVKFYARKAIELDDTLAEAHASLAWSSFIYDWDWDGAVKEFRRAIELDHRYAPAHQWYAFMLASQGRFDEALLEAHTAQENDPSSVSVRRSLGYCYFYARKYEQVRYHLDRAIAMNPTAEESYRIQGLILTLQKQFPAARESASRGSGAGARVRIVHQGNARILSRGRRRYFLCAPARGGA